MPTLKARNSKLPTLAFRSDLLFPFLNLNFELHHRITRSPHHHTIIISSSIISIIIIIIIILVLILTLILITSSWSSSSSLLMALPQMSHRSQVVTNRTAIMSVANGQKFITEASSRFRRVQSSSILNEMLLVIVRCMSSMLSVPHSASEVVSYHNLCDLLRYFIQLM